MPSATALLRAARRLAGFATMLAGAAGSALIGRAGPSPRERAEWLRRWSRRVLRSIGVAVEVSGTATPPTAAAGLMVANHLGYLDVLALASIQPLAFVAKREVRGWPVFGRLATAAGTLFIRRGSVADVPRTAAAIQVRLDAGIPVVVFPEGTSTDGTRVLPFRPGLFSVAAEARHAVTPVWIGYESATADVRTHACYWGDMTLLPHLLRLLTLERVVVRIRVGAPVPATGCRKELARRARDSVVRLGAGIFA